MLQSRRQITSILLLVMLFVALLPIPLVSFQSKAGKDLSRPFPCQDRPCGCRSAEQCKKKCCCFNKQQKLAWAEKNGISASEVVNFGPLENKVETKKKSCCVSQKTSQACETTTVKTAKPQRAPSTRVKYVLGIAAQQCRGVHQTLNGQLVFVLPKALPLLSYCEVLFGRLSVSSERLSAAVIEPPVPPPRLGIES